MSYLFAELGRTWFFCLGLEALLLVEAAVEVVSLLFVTAKLLSPSELSPVKTNIPTNIIPTDL